MPQLDPYHAMFASSSTRPGRKRANSPTDNEGGTDRKRPKNDGENDGFLSRVMMEGDLDDGRGLGGDVANLRCAYLSVILCKSCLYNSLQISD